MEHHTNNEKWVNEVMDSLTGIQRAPASPHMYDNVMRRVGQGKPGSGSSSSLVFKRVAAAAILLFVINLASIIHLSHKTKAVQHQGVYQAVSDEISYLSEDSY